MGAHGKKFTDNPQLDPAVGGKLFKIALGVGVLGTAASLAALGMGEEVRKQFHFSWLVAFMTFLAVSLGGLFFTVLHHLVRASWSTALRRSAENLAWNLPLMLVFFIPIVLGLGDLYHWSHPEAVAADPILKWKSGYLNSGFFLIRAAAYFAIWLGFAWFYRTLSLKQDETGDLGLTFKMRKAAPVATLLFAMTISFAGFDWLMSLDPHWFSTIFGVYIFAGAMISIFAALALSGLWLTGERGNLRNTITVGMLHDSGKLMFGFTVFWTYIAFSQYFLIWYANIPEETVWFMMRKSNGWERLSLLLLLGHFIVPFWVLMSRHVKRNRRMLGLMACWMLLMQFVDMYFLAMPVLHHHGPHPHWLDLTCLLGVGGLFVALFARRMTSAATVAHRDPQLVASMGYDNG